MLASVDDNVLETNIQQQSMTTKAKEDEADKVQKVRCFNFDDIHAHRFGSFDWLYFIFTRRQQMLRI